MDSLSRVKNLEKSTSKQSCVILEMIIGET